jgi:hypothetical protein
MLSKSATAGPDGALANARNLMGFLDAFKAGLEAIQPQMAIRLPGRRMSGSTLVAGFPVVPDDGKKISRCRAKKCIMR